MRRLFASGVLVSGLSGLSAQIGLSNIPFTAHHFQIVAITIQQSGLLILDSSTTMYSTSQRIMVSASFQKLWYLKFRLFNVPILPPLSVLMAVPSSVKLNAI
jgi:hypothetical protein